MAHPRAGRPARPHVQRRDRRRCGGAAPQSRACRPHDTRPCRPHHDTGTVTFSIRTFSKPATALAKSLTRPAAWFNTSAPTGAFCSAEADNVRSYAAAGRFLSDAQQRRGYSGSGSGRTFAATIVAEGSCASALAVTSPDRLRRPVPYPLRQQESQRSPWTTQARTSRAPSWRPAATHARECDDSSSWPVTVSLVGSQRLR